MDVFATKKDVLCNLLLNNIFPYCLSSTCFVYGCTFWCTFHCITQKLNNTYPLSICMNCKHTKEYKWIAALCKILREIIPGHFFLQMKPSDPFKLNHVYCYPVNKLHMSLCGIVKCSHDTYMYVLLLYFEVCSNDFTPWLLLCHGQIYWWVFIVKQQINT